MYLIYTSNIFDWWFEHTLVLELPCRKKKILSFINACNLWQIDSLPTRVFTHQAGHTSSTCIDHIYTNVPELCSNTVPVGFSDHNFILANAKIIYKRSYKRFADDHFLEDVSYLQQCKCLQHWQRWIFLTYWYGVGIHYINRSNEHKAWWSITVILYSFIVFFLNF